MNKGLEALEILKRDLNEHYLSDTAKDIQYKFIETELKRLEELEKECEMFRTMRNRLSNIIHDQNEILRIIKEDFGIKMSFDGDCAIAFIKLSKDKIIVVGEIVNDQKKVDLLKEWLK